MEIKELPNYKQPWYKYYLYAKSRTCRGRYKERGILCLMNPFDVKEIWFRDQAWLLKSPSIDRIDGMGNYEPKNIRFIERRINQSQRSYINAPKERPWRRTPVEQIELKTNNVLKVFKGLTFASKETGIGLTSIGNCVRGLSKTAGGFVWKYQPH